MDYSTLVKYHPELFRNHEDEDSIKIILDSKEIENWREKQLQELANSQKPTSWADIGLILDDPYYLIIRDLVRFSDGRMNGYNRIFGRGELAGGKGVAVLPKFEEKILVLKQFRHPTRSWECEIPRGYAEPNITALAQAKTEILEEIQGEITELHDLGFVNENTGSVAFPVSLFMAELNRVGKANKKESIKEIFWLSVKDFEDWISSGKISDGFTIAAYTRAKLKGLI
jgi:ADP-ribose pyrophosphatase